MNNLCPIWAQYKSFRINLARVRDLWRVCTMEHYRRIDERVPAASRRSTREPGCCKRGHRVGGSSGSTLRFAWEVEPFAMRVAWTARGTTGRPDPAPSAARAHPRARRRRRALHRRRREGAEERRGVGEGICLNLLVRGRRRESSAAEQRPVIPPEQMTLAMRQARHPLADGNCREHVTD